MYIKVFCKFSFFNKVDQQKQLKNVCMCVRDIRKFWT